ncbi:Invertase (fragment) [Taphrina deformans PYCC 5710]|uniref:Invertase n=1 Tax=Taphrina deformans (strain PYCC 5710 / ATCC 11124 / CBS 356.35 / IMI 108563 / JCM 9778 / NBRC 8474) TaxID=1097556 RepID=R4X9A3_TAPDE
MPIAIAPDQPDHGIFSGSAVVDVNNTSGFFDISVPAQERIVAMYTLNTPTSQTQEIAYSLDGGTSFLKYRGNPVIDVNSTQFRDPKVFFHSQTNQWIVATVLAQQYQVVFYASPDLKNWTELSRFGPAGYLGFQYEVPDLVQIPIEGTNESKWVLFLSINPGAPQGGSFVQYFIGEFDGKHFKPDDYSIGIQDFGKDFYASQTWSNLPPEQGVVGLAWANNWDYTNSVPVSGAWRTIQTLARTLTLRRTYTNPEVQRLVVASALISLHHVSPTNVYADIPLSGHAAIDLNITTTSATSDIMNATTLITIESSDSGFYEAIIIGVRNSMVWIDRENAPRNWRMPFFSTKLSTFVQTLPVNSDSAPVKLRAVIDRSVLELFINDGVQSAVVLFYMSCGRKPDNINVRVSEGMSAVVSATSLRGIWQCGNCSNSAQFMINERDEL